MTPDRKLEKNDSSAENEGPLLRGNLLVLINFLHLFFREEDEFEESDGAQSNKSNDDASANDNNANESQTPSLGKKSHYLQTKKAIIYKQCSWII